MKNLAFCLLLAVTFLAGCSISHSQLVKASGKPHSPQLNTPQRLEAKKLNAKAIKLIHKDDLDNAERLLKQAIAKDPGYAAAHNSLGEIYYRQDRLYEAAWQFQYAAKLMPRRAEPLNNLGLVFEKANELDKAVTRYEAALKLDPDNTQIIGNLARAKVARGDHDKELRHLLQTLAVKDSRPAWRRWARKQLALMADRSEATTQP